MPRRTLLSADQRDRGQAPLPLQRGKDARVDAVQVREHITPKKA